MATWGSTWCEHRRRTVASRILEFFELSLRVDAADALDVQAAFERFLTKRRVPVSSIEETKTETVLRHLAARP